MRLFFNHLENAFETLRSHRVRTLLTVLGFTIAIASITAIFSLVHGASDFFRSQVATTSDTVAIVRTKHPNTTQTTLAGAQTLDMTTTLTDQDAVALSRIPDASVAPMSLLHTSLHTKDSTVDGQRITLIGSTPALAETSNLSLLDGQFLTDMPGSSGIVMGYQLAIDLFGTEKAIGSVVTIRDEPFTVIGVLKQLKQPVNYHGVDFDRSAIISLDALKQFTQNVAQVQQIIITAPNKKTLETVTTQAHNVLHEQHHGDNDFTILTGDDITRPQNELLTMITNIMIVIAVVSLLAGGVGIMNIMLASAAERKREVGIRRALGATRGHIVNQFLIESAIFGTIGGLLGYGIGMALAFGASFYLPFTPTLDWRVAVFGVGLALCAGIIFGIYPAINAANKDPIESLRQ